jgi:hypothetical protein
MLKPEMMSGSAVSDRLGSQPFEVLAYLIDQPFEAGLHKAFAFAIGACLLATIMSWSRGCR